MYWLFLIVPGLAIIYFGVLHLFTDKNSCPRLDLAKLKDKPWRFGRDFLWGTATSAYQVEGHCTNNNWYRFESAVDAQGRPRIRDGQKAGVSADHWNLYKEDIQLMKALSLNAYRFSVEWSKVETEPGKYDKAVLDHYENIVDELKKNGIEPMITLHHFTDPLWFEDRGGFLQDDSPEIFAGFAEEVVGRLGPKVKLWATFNEPTVYAMMGYLTGVFPPALKDAEKAGAVLGNLMRAHTAAYRRIKRVEPSAQVGLVAAIACYDPARPWHLLDAMQARASYRNMAEMHLRYLVDGVFALSLSGARPVRFDSGTREAFDFFGLNYYTRIFRKFVFSGGGHAREVVKAPPERVTDMGWEIYPPGLYRALKMIAGYTSKPVYITENGLADDSDTKRAGFVEDHLRVLNRALAEGMNIRGYFYWSLLDNFEWAFGFTKRFGLYHVDFTSLKRTLRAGSLKYPEIIRQSRD
jgi:beta-glucosidase